jgi:anaerobic magnesium-protoporphyrin IX monomethyl ester cyclase
METKERYHPTNKKGPVIIVHPDTGEGLDQITPPLGTLAIAGYLEREGVGFIHIDQRVEPNTEEIVSDAVRNGALCLGVACQTGPQISYAIKLIQAVKAEFPQFPIVWGGWHGSILPEQTLSHPAVDFLIKGQAEGTMLDLVRCLQNGGQVEGVVGLGYKADGKVIMNPDRPMIELDSLPWMAYHLIDHKNYPGPSHRRRSPLDRYSTFRSSQGCPWRCAYCADPLVFSRRWKKLSAQRTVDELQNLVEKHGITYVDFVDDTFIVSPERTSEIAKEMIKRKLPLKWSACARTGMIAGLTDDIWAMLAEAGCDLVHPGVEASSQEMLDYIHKDEKHENTLLAAEKLRKAGIAGLYAFMVGFPEEPKETAVSTFRMVKRLKEIDANNIIPVNFYVPYPGNVLYDRSRVKGFEPPVELSEWANFGTRMGRATPWLKREFKDEVMKHDKYYLPAAYPSRFMQYKMKNNPLGWLYKIFHRIAKFRVQREWYSFDVDWKILFAYWKFWEKWHRRIRLPNLMFR